MKHPWKFWTVLLLLGLGFGSRFSQAQRGFEDQQKLFPVPEKGVFQVFIAEDPEILFDHQLGSHDTGRTNGFYQPAVREVRAVCVLLSKKEELLTEVAIPSLRSGQALPNAPTDSTSSPQAGAAPRNDSYKQLPPIKVRCTFRLSSEAPQPALSYGQTVEIQGKIQKPAEAMNPGSCNAIL